MLRKAPLLLTLFALFALPAGANAETRAFSNSSVVAIPDVQAASPYPSTIGVKGMSGQVSQVTVGINDFTHDSVDDVALVLVAPGGKNVILMGFRCSSISHATFIFDDFGLGPIPPAGNTCVSGTYKPASGTFRNNTVPPPGPGGPYGQKMSSLKGGAPNGSWQLYAVDSRIGGSGGFAGWNLTVTTIPSPSKKKCRKHKRRNKRGKCVKKGKRKK